MRNSAFSSKNKKGRDQMKEPSKLDNSDIQKIRSFSKKLSVFCLLMLVVLPILVPFIWQGDITSLAQRANLEPGTIQNPIQTWQRIVGMLLTEIPVVFMCIALWQVRKCLQGFANGEVFTKDAVMHLKKFSVWMMRSALAALLVGILLSTLLTIGNAPGSRHIAISVSTEQVLLLFFSCVVWLMAQIISQGHELAQENSSFI
jgi:Protein of unknown function (DUF2975)